MPAPRRWPWRGANLDRVRRQRDGPVLPVHFVQGNWLDPLPSRLRGAVDVVVSNPPYVAAAEWPDLAGEVRREPVAALVAGDGTDGTPGLADVEARAVPGLGLAGAPRCGRDRTGAAPGRRGRPHGPGHGVRRRPGGDGPGPASAGAGRSHPVSGPPAGRSPPVGRCPGRARRRSGDRRRRATAGTSWRHATVIDGAAALRCAVRAEPRRSGPLLRGRRPPGPGDRVGVGVDQGDRDPDQPDVARTPHRHGAGPTRRRGRRSRRAHHHAGDARACARCVATASRCLVCALRRPDGAPIVDPAEVGARFTSTDVALIVDGGICRGLGPTVVDCTASPPVVRHVGALPETLRRCGADDGQSTSQVVRAAVGSGG